MRVSRRGVNRPPAAAHAAAAAAAETRRAPAPTALRAHGGTSPRHARAPTYAAPVQALPLAHTPTRPSGTSSEPCNTRRPFHAPPRTSARARGWVGGWCE